MSPAKTIEDYRKDAKKLHGASAPEEVIATQARIYMRSREERLTEEHKADLARIEKFELNGK
jgi:hypothetical protein